MSVTVRKRLTVANLAKDMPLYSPITFTFIKNDYGWTASCTIKDETTEFIVTGLEGTLEEAEEYLKKELISVCDDAYCEYKRLDQDGRSLRKMLRSKLVRMTP